MKLDNVSMYGQSMHEQDTAQSFVSAAPASDYGMVELPPSNYDNVSVERFDQPDNHYTKLERNDSTSPPSNYQIIDNVSPVASTYVEMVPN